MRKIYVWEGFTHDHDTERIPMYLWEWLAVHFPSQHDFVGLDF
jgi:hypothetical protein